MPLPQYSNGATLRKQEAREKGGSDGQRFDAER